MINRNRLLLANFLAVAVIAIGGLATTSADAQITAGATASNSETSGPFDDAITISSFNVTPGTDRKLVLAASWENGNSDISATWNGTETFSTAANTALGRNSAILYLDNPTPGTGNIVVTYGANTGSRVGAVSLTGAADSVNVTSTAVGLSGSLTTSVPNTLVTGVYTSNNDTGTITSPFANSLYNGDSFSSRGQAGFQNEATAGLKSYTWTDTNAAANNNALAGFVPVNESPTPGPGEIAVIRSESLRVAGQITGIHSRTLSFDAGDGADKIVVQVSAEGGSVSSITYNGVTLTAAISKEGRNQGIYYLDEPFTAGSADLVVNFDGTTNGIGLGVVSLAGTAPGVSAIASDLSDTSVMLEVLEDGSFVLAGYGDQDSGIAFPDFPLTQIYGGDIGSAKGAAGYENGVAAGLYNYSFTSGGGGSPITFAAAFAPLPVPEPHSIAIWTLLGLGLGIYGYLRRRKR